MKIRSATPSDAAALNNVLQDLIATGKRIKPSDPDFVLTHYISDPGRIKCSIAQDENGLILGFQSLKLAEEGNPYGTPIGWGIIGTHIRTSAARRGVSKSLFASSEQAAKTAGLPKIEALIGANNTPALAFYESLGFRKYKNETDAVGKSFTVV